MKKFIVLTIALFSIMSFAQKKQNILISNRYDFQTEKNSYNINTVLKAILVSNNFQVYFEDEVLPMEIAQNRCNALKGVLVDKSTMFLTKVVLQIKDCQNNLIYETVEVKSREKDIQTGYMEAIKLLSPEIKKYKASLVLKKEAVKTTTEVVEAPIVSEFKTYLNCKMEEVFNGFHVTEIKDNSGFVLLSMQKTKTPNVFIANRDKVSGVFTKTGNKGIFEYYIGDKYMVEEFSF